MQPLTYCLAFECWQIERGDPDGSDRITIVSGLSHPWGVAVHDDYLYFTDRNFEVIERVNKLTGADKVVLRDNVSGLRVLKVHYRESEYHRETCHSFTVVYFSACCFCFLLVTLSSLYESSLCRYIQRLHQQYGRVRAALPASAAGSVHLCMCYRF